MRLLVLLFLTGCTSMSVNELRATFHATNAADVGTTVYGLDHGCVEGNPLAANMAPGGIVFLGAIESLAAEALCGNAEAEEKVCWIAFTWVKALTAGWNTTQLIRGCN